jgi:hypothetical protein
MNTIWFEMFQQYWMFIANISFLAIFLIYFIDVLR